MLNNNNKMPFTKEKVKPKLKKNALEYVDFEIERKNDPKYKTEMCKSWVQTNFCVYGNKCRFAHGKQELISRTITAPKYKVKDCKSFRETGICMYGARCNFKHDERKIAEMERSFFSLLPANNSCGRRLRIFETFSPSTSPLNMSNTSESYAVESYLPCFIPQMNSITANERSFMMNSLPLYSN
jgi:hypothetical protein